MRHILLTGATGTIGSALVPQLLASRDTTVSLLMRAADTTELLARHGKMLAYWGYAPGDADAARLKPLLGDISLPSFGWSESDFADHALRHTHIIHCAASVKLNMPLEQARATAVLPTRSILALARLGKAAKIDLVSTVGVWGRTPGHMPERALPEVSDFHNTYEAAKAEAERVVWAEGQGLPITLHRPSMVVGDAKSGQVIHFQVFYHLCEFLSGRRTFGVMPDLGQTRLDTIPVDWVAAVICWANQRTDTAGQIYHLCSGPQQAISLVQLQHKVRAAWAGHGLPLPKLRGVNRRWLERLIPLIGALAGAKTRRALRGLSPVLEYLAEDQGFANQRTASALAAAGLPVPALENYLDQVIAYYLSRTYPDTKP